MGLLSSVWGVEVLNDAKSPQYLSACWIIHYDALQLNASDFNIIQRSTMALLFYSTDGWNWQKNYNFLTSKHECEWNDGNLKGFYCPDDQYGTKIDLGEYVFQISHKV